MKNIIIILAMVFGFAIAAQANHIRIDVVQLDENDNVIATESVTLNDAVVDRVAATLDAVDGSEDSTLIKLKNRLIVRMQELVMQYEQQVVRDQKIAEMIQAEQAVTPITIE